MKRFLKHLIYFVTPLALVLILGDTIVSKTLKKSKTFAYGEYSTWNAIWEGDVNSEIVIYGSSRAWVHIDPSVLTKELSKSAFNLGMDGYNFDAQYFRHTELLKYNTKPRTIIHSVDIFTLAKRTDLFNPDQFLPYMLYNPTLEAFTRNYVGFNKADFNIPFIRYFGNRRAIAQAGVLLSNPNFRANEGRKKGFEGKQRGWNDDLKLAKTKMEFYEVSIDSATLKLFEQYLQQCASASIQVVFVYTPEYIEGQRFVKNREQIMNLYSVLGKKYNIPFLDYSDNTLSHDKKYFYNASHLNKTGAELFTYKLAQDLQSRRIIN